MQDPAADGCFRTEQKPPFPVVGNTPDSRYMQRKCLFKHCQRAEFLGPGWKADNVSWGAEGRPGHGGRGMAWSGRWQADLWQEGTHRGMLANDGPLRVRILQGVLGKGHVWVYACAYCCLCMVCSHCVCWSVCVCVCVQAGVPTVVHAGACKDMLVCTCARRCVPAISLSIMEGRIEVRSETSIKPLKSPSAERDWGSV